MHNKDRIFNLLKDNTKKFFLPQEIMERLELKRATVFKWLKVLVEEKKILKGYKWRYGINRLGKRCHLGRHIWYYGITEEHEQYIKGLNVVYDSDTELLGPIE